MAGQNQYPYEYQTQFGQASYEDQIAKALMASGMRKPQGQMVSGYYVKPATTQYLADLFAQLGGAYLGKRATDTRTGAMEQAAKDERADLVKAIQTAAGTPENSATPNFVMSPDTQGNIPTVYSPGAPGDMAKAAQIAAASRFPNVQEFGKQLRAQQQNAFTTAASKSTPESVVAAGQAGGNPALLQPEKDETWGPIGPLATPPGGTPIYGSLSSKGKPVFAPQGTNVNVGATRADQALVGEHYRTVMDPKMRQTAETAATTLSAASQALNIIAKVPLNMGTGAGMITEVQKLAKFLGKEVDPRAPASEVYQGLIIPQVGQIITMFGSGTGLSDADREFAKQAVAVLQRDPRAAQALLMETIKRSWKYATTYNQMVGAGEGLAEQAGMNPAIFKSIVLPIQFSVAKELNLPDNPWEWPNAFETLQQGTSGQPAGPQGPTRKRW